jgi:hypothetical protein
MGSSLPVASANAREVVATGRDENTVLEIIATSRNGSKWFPGLAKKLSKDKPAAAVHHLTGERERTCYDWCAGATDPPARTLIKLLHSPAGRVVLAHVMRGCKEDWWLAAERDHKLAAAAQSFIEQLDLLDPRG